MLLRRLSDTKHACYRVSFPFINLFVKIHHSKREGMGEYAIARRLTRVLASQESNLPFWLPSPYFLLTLNHYAIIVYKWVEGSKVSDVLLATGSDRFSLAQKMTYSICHIHHALGRRKRFDEKIDCEQRLIYLLGQEGRFAFKASEMASLRGLTIKFFEIVYQVATGFPCDYYKDANPANWILEASESRLVALDFEGNRSIPFVVDLLNITEYAADYLTTSEKEELLAYYKHERSRLDPKWAAQVSQFDIRLIWAVFGVYRHQEQILHRIRDLTLSRYTTSAWHKQALEFHIQAVRSHLDFLDHLETLSSTLRKRVHEIIHEMLAIYEAGAQHLGVGVPNGIV